MDTHFRCGPCTGGKELTWVKPPRLPPHLSNPVIFRMIGDALGSYVDANMSCKVTGDMTVAQILVMLDLRDGLMGDICLNTVVGNAIRVLDYDGVPFKCHRRHSLDHLVAQCSRPFHGSKQFEGKSGWSKEADVNKKARVKSSDRREFKDNFRQTMVEMVPSVVQIRDSMHRGTDDAVSDKPQESVAAPLDPSGTGPTDVSFFPITSFFGVLFSSGGSSNLTLPSSGEGIIPPRPVVSCSIPFVNNSTTDPLVTTSSSLSGSSEDGNVPYVLRNRSIFSDNSQTVGRGLGITRRPLCPTRWRGRKSFMSLDQNRAIFYLATRKQLSIQWALRAPEAHYSGVKGNFFPSIVEGWKIPKKNSHLSVW